VSPLYFFLKNLATFFSRHFCGVTPDFFFAKTDDLFCSSLYRFLLLSLGCHPLEGVTLYLFYLSDLVSPLFFVNLPTKKCVSFGCHPPGGCHPGRSAPSPPPSDATGRRDFSAVIFGAKLQMDKEKKVNFDG